MANGTTFMVHAGGEIVTRQQLASIPTPATTPTWRPISHADLVEMIDNRLANAGYRIAREQFATKKDGLWFFGALDLEPAGDTALEVVPGVGLAVGFQHSNDKRRALRVVAGGRVFVCDNLALSGDREVFRNQHTHGVMGRLRESLGIYFGGLEAQRASLQERFERWQATALSDVEAKAIIYDALQSETIPQRILPDVHNAYFRAEEQSFEDCAPRSKWGLHNAFTRAIKALTPGPMFEANFGLTSLLG